MKADANRVLAIDIGGTQYGLAVVDRDGRILSRYRGRTDRAGGAEWMIAQILDKSRHLLKSWRVKACGIGFGGPVDFANQTVLSSTHVSGWEGIRLTELIGQELNLPTVVENDANAGGLGELTYGAGRGCRQMVYYTISTGIGGGILVDGAIYRGSDGNAGELGHVVVVPDGPLCDCGNRGCLEALCSGKSIGFRASRAMAEQPHRGRALCRCAGSGEITARTVFAAAGDGDRLAGELVAETCTYLGMGLAGVMNCLAPERIVIGGGVSRAGETLFAPLRKATTRFTMPVHRAALDIRPARRGGNSVLLGAAALGFALG